MLLFYSLPASTKITKQNQTSLLVDLNASLIQRETSQF